jgi:hypothetical protein
MVNSWSMLGDIGGRLSKPLRCLDQTSGDSFVSTDLASPFSGIGVIVKGQARCSIERLTTMIQPLGQPATVL